MKMKGDGETSQHREERKKERKKERKGKTLIEKTTCRCHLVKNSDTYQQNPGFSAEFGL